MSLRLENQRAETYDRLYSVFADETRRGIVRILREHTGAISETELSDRLATADSGSESEETSPKSLRVRLYHVHLPKMAESGLVEWDREAETVAATDHVVYDAFRVDELIEPQQRDEILSALAADGRLEIIEIVESADGPVAREDLARQVASMETDDEPTESRVEKITVQLHHSHLPRLEDVGLVDYDPGTGLVTSRDLDALTAVIGGNVSDGEPLASLES